MMAKQWLAATALLLALGGCGEEAAAEPATVPVPATTSEAPPPPPAKLPVEAATSTPDPRRTTAPKLPPIEEVAGTGTDVFVAAVQSRLPEIALDRRDEEIAEIAERACAALLAAEEADEIVAETRTLGTGRPKATDRATARELIRLAIDTVCPDQDRRIGEF